MTITGGTSLPKEDIDRMVREAEQYAEEDRRRKEAVEAKNQAENLVYSTEKSLREFGDKIGEGDRQQVEEALKNLKEKLAGDDTVAIRSATEQLQQASYKLAEAVYSQAQQDQGGQAQQPPGGNGGDGGAAGGAEQPRPDDVVDAEIVDEDQQKDKGA